MIYLRILSIIIILASSVTSFAKNNSRFTPDDIKANCIVYLSKKVYLGEAVNYRVTLHTNYNRILSIQLLDGPETNNLKNIGSISDYGYEIKSINNNEWSIELTNKYFTPEKIGQYSISDCKFKITYGIKKIVSDPFWGVYEVDEPYSVIVDVPRVKGKVLKLPFKQPANFSRAVGEFSFECSSSELIVKPNSDCRISFIIAGEGLLDDIAMPDIRSAFSDNLKLKSISTESGIHAKSDGTLVSQVIYDCVFYIKSDTEDIIKSIPFCYYDSQKQRYITIHTEPCLLKSAKEKRNIEGGKFI